MCFSAEASFAASGALAAASIAIARIPKAKPEIPLSLFPAIFSVHQFIEGILWLNHDGVISEGYNSLAVYAFVFIAFVLWPVYVPFAAHLTESGKLRRKIMLICQLLGIYVAITLLICIVRNSVEVSVVGHSFSYKVIGIPDNFLAPYFVSSLVPFLVSSRKQLVIFGIVLAFSSAVASMVASSTTYPSVWCFYAAILSLGLYFYFRYRAKAFTGDSTRADEMTEKIAENKN